MFQNLFRQTIIALIWDFDNTLIPGYMETPLFRHYGVDEEKFWKEVDGLPEFYRKQGLELISRDTLYLNHILTYVRSGRFAGLNNKLLRRLGAELEFYAGLPEFLRAVKDHVARNAEYGQAEIDVEHYIVSIGLRQMILGSRIAEYIDGVWGCEFVETVAPPDYLEPKGQQALFHAEPTASEIVELGYVIDNTTKTRAIFEINKGTNKEPTIDVNAKIKPEDRRIPIENMIYVADGPSDIPVFSIIKQYGGQAYAVYGEGTEQGFEQARELQAQNRIDAFGPADYRERSHTAMLLLSAVDHVANRIVEHRRRMVGERVGSPPKHLPSDGDGLPHARDPRQLGLGPD
ncbi:MAG TPA: HAD family hydrolase [bacterium]|nr:HAD family hydrolase [bacterium]